MAMTIMLLARGTFAGGALRYAMESLPPLRYLQDSYYERRLDALETALVDHAVLARPEMRHRLNHLSRGDADPADAEPPHNSNAEKPSGAPRPLTQGGALSSKRDVNRPPRFGIGDLVTARNVHPRGHTRLPRYVRGRRGTITRLHSPAVFPDTDAHGRGEHAQYVYTVRFKSQELWGDTAEPNETVHVGLWESYLEAA